MINFFKKVYYKLWLKHYYSKVQDLTKVKFKLRMKSIKLGERFTLCVKKLESLGVNNPKAIVTGERPPTGKIK